MTIQKVTVLGSGQMGRQIAAHLLNAGLEVELIKMTTPLGGEPVAYIKNPKNNLLYDNASINNLTYRSYDAYIIEDSEADLVIEAIIEDLETKQTVFEKVAKVVKPTTILTTNTSGLSISEISEKLPKHLKNQFLGLHFFTPVRHMNLVEMIPHEEASVAIIETVQQFVSERLGKDYIVAKDVIGFLANRIGFYTNHDIMSRGEEKGWPVTTVDAISGEALARPKMGPYRLTDYSGVDLFHASYLNYAEDEREASFYKERPVSNQMVEKGWHGDKVGQGYYKKENSKRYAINLETGHYEEASFPTFDIFDEFEHKNFTHNFDVIFSAEDDIGKFMWQSLRNVLYYSAINVGYATDDYKDIDRAMVWGYNWSLGPFQIWDAMGFERVKERIEKEMGALPEWLSKRSEPFYETGDSLKITPNVHDLTEEVVWYREGQSELLNTADDVLVFVLRTKNNTLNNGVLSDIIEAVDKLENEKYQGLVIASEGKNFSVGSDVNIMMENIENDTVEASLEESTQLGYKLITRLKYVKKPLVTAIKGYALGGGAEIAMQSPTVVAAAETYIGLTEVGVGLIPGGGGVAELADRIYRSNHSRYEKKRLLYDAFTTIAYGVVSKDAYDAKVKGLLKPTDHIVMASNFVLKAAIDLVRFQATYGFLPNHPENYQALGTDFKAVVQGTTRNWVEGDFVTAYDKVLADAIGDVLSGGDVPMGTMINQEYLMEKEKENFIRLSKNKETYDRMLHMMKTGKPLRN